ncbi:MAG TPA: hypothetical protein VHM26_07100 [Chitinophagaceae bacterium]|nr:hypothetical protein [Chitinophagaceae bacterium]
MKKYLLYACLLMCTSVARSQQRGFQEVNPVIHDESYIARFGTTPGAAFNETERVRTHLSYVEQLLRSTTKELTATQQANRTKVLDHLRDYWQAGKFPVNRAYAGERRPCFIDDDGTICAVGYLVEQTLGRETAEAINTEHQYDFLLDMNEPALATWAEENGFTLEECAMIQPTYGWQPDETVNKDIKPGYGVTSGVVGGVNLAVNVANLSSRWRNNRDLQFVGLITGAGQVIMGAANIKKQTTTFRMGGGNLITSYKAQNTLSYVNIAVGTGTMVSSVFNLLMHKKNNENKNAFSLYSYPNEASSVTMGLSLTRRI